jgi:Domain of unknown function (DUF3786)/Putative Fe-S cluster
MPHPKNAMEIFLLLDKSNCRECGEKTCLAFAGAVFKGQKKIDRCPKLEQAIIEQFSGEPQKKRIAEPNRDEYLKTMRKALAGLDLEAAAGRVGGQYSGGRLTLKILGRNFSVDTKGHLSADIHINPWVAVPFLDYVVNSKGLPPSGRWMSFRELREGQERYPLFQKRCEAPMKRIADAYTDLFDDLVRIFGGKQVERQFESDISVVLHPLPRVPIMICFRLPEDGLGSTLNVFFDDTADENLSIGSVFNLGTGLAQMFDKLARRHGFAEAESYK